MQAFIKNVTTGKLSKGDKLGQVDHATMNYPPFRRNFYIEVPELARLSDAEVTELRKQLDDVKVGCSRLPCLQLRASCADCLRLHSARVPAALCCHPEGQG